MKIENIMKNYSVTSKTSMLELLVKAEICQEFPNKFPLNVNAILDEMDVRVTRNKTLTKYIMYKLDMYYGKNNVDITSQEKYTARHADIFEAEFWNKPKYFKFTGTEMISELPLDEAEILAFEKLEIDKNTSVASARGIMTALDFGHTYPSWFWDKYSPLVENVIGGFPRIKREYPMTLLNALYGSLDLDKVYNVFKYEPMIRVLLEEGIRTLTEKQREVILCRYLHHMFLSDTANKLDVSPERARQIEAKALRLLRNKLRTGGVKFLINLEDDLPNDTQQAMHRYLMSRDCYATKIIDITVGNCLSLGVEAIYNKKFYRDLLLSTKSPLEFFNKCVYTDEIISEERASIPIEDLDLSIRSFNCLKRRGIKTLDDLLVVVNHPEDLLSIRNFGKRSLVEVLNKLLLMGHHIPEELYVYLEDDYD